MFSQLSERLARVIKNLTGKGRLTPENIQETLREVRIALLEADVALPAAEAFMEHVQIKAVGQEVLESLSPGQALIKVVYDELVQLMGEENHQLNLRVEPPVVILMAGLQGSGKTTTAAKLALRLKDIEKKSVLLVSLDVYRPAAIQQLKILAEQVGVTFFANDLSDPVAIGKAALLYARQHAIDVMLVDTAGRLHIDDVMMDEIKRIHAALSPAETLFVVDSMTGQDAALTAKHFHEALPLTGVILTKADGDARGGAALSIRHLTGKPIKFMGVGEKIDALEPFYPDRLASRILDMGDVLSLVEKAERTLDKNKAAELAKKLQKGKPFDLSDFLIQLKQISKMGGIQGIVSQLPGMGQLPGHVKDQLNDQVSDEKIVQIEAIICSMTLLERRIPTRIKNSHKRRIAAGSGTTVQDVNRLLKQFEQMQKMIGKMSKKGGWLKMARGLQSKMPFMGMKGGMPWGK